MELWITRGGGFGPSSCLGGLLMRLVTVISTQELEHKEDGMHEWFGGCLYC